MDLFKEIRAILIADVPEDANSPYKHPMLLAKENILTAMIDGAAECYTLRKHTANRLLMILNSAVDPASTSTQEMKKRAINQIIYNRAEALMHGALDINGYNSAAHAMVTHLSHFIKFVEKHSNLKATRKLPHNWDTRNLIWPGGILIPNSNLSSG